jgi:anti-sigma-K factor RskA
MSQDQYTDAMREHIEELSAAYALGALSDDEAGLREFEQLVEAGDPVLSKSLEHMLGATTLLASAVPQIDPPPALRASILSAVANQKLHVNGKAAQPNVTAPSEDAIRLKKRTRFFIGTSLVAGLLLCYILALNVSNSAKLDRSNDLMRSLLRQTDSLRAVNAEASPKPDNGQQVDEGTSKNNPLNKRFFSMFGDADLKLVTLASTPLGAARQHLFFSPKQKTIYFVYDNEHPMDAAKTYEISAIVGSKAPVSIGTFKIDPKKDPPVYAFATKIRNADSFTISVVNGAVVYAGNMPTGN